MLGEESGTGAGRSSQETVRERAMKIALDRASSEWNDLRDRAIFVHVRGIQPTHLRSATTRLLVAISCVRRGCVGEMPACFQIADEFVRMLELDHHPMGRKVEQLKSLGWKLAPYPHGTHRRGFAKILMRNDDDQYCWVKTDGAVRDFRLG